MASDGVYSVTLDEAIEAMRLTAADMSVKYKETSLSVCFIFLNKILGSDPRDLGLSSSGSSRTFFLPFQLVLRSPSLTYLSFLDRRL